jgi:hypothetical protein
LQRRDILLYRPFAGQMGIRAAGAERARARACRDGCRSAVKKGWGCFSFTKTPGPVELGRSLMHTALTFPENFLISNSASFDSPDLGGYPSTRCLDPCGPAPPPPDFFWLGFLVSLIFWARCGNTVLPLTFCSCYVLTNGYSCAPELVRQARRRLGIVLLGGWPARRVFC